MLRILPITIIFMTIFMVTKLLQTIEIYNNDFKYILISDTHAQQEEQEPNKSDEQPTEGKALSQEEKAREAARNIKPKDNSQKKYSSEEERTANKRDNKEEYENSNITTLAPETVGVEKFSEYEVEILSNLKKRREELNKWEQDIITKENILKTMEFRIDKKLKQLTDLKKEVTELLFAYQKQDEEKIKSLVRIYENMKPQDAARIFEEIDMATLLQVIDQMKEAKAAAILSKMNPKTAKEITMYLANRKKLSSPN